MLPLARDREPSLQDPIMGQKLRHRGRRGVFSQGPRNLRLPSQPAVAPRKLPGARSEGRRRLLVVRAQRLEAPRLDRSIASR